MPYDPKTGKYTPEDTTVSGRVTKLLSQDSPLMKQAATQAKRTQNRRGLLNSSMTVEAAQAGRINAALPIASQESAQAHQTNLQGFDIESRERMQGRGFEHETGLQGRDIESRQKMQQTDIEANRERLELELGSREKMQQADMAAQKERLGMQLSQQEKLALQDLRAAQERLNTEMESRERMLGTEVASREGMQQQEIQHQQFMQSVDNETRERIAGLDREAQERIANMNVAASERQAASSLAASFESSYAQVVSNIMANPEIPADARQRYLDHAARMRDSNLRLVEQFYSVDLDWGGGGGNAGPPTGYVPRELLNRVRRRGLNGVGVTV